MKRIDPNRYAPLGRSNSQILIGGYFVLFLAVIRSLSFVLRYFDARDQLFVGIYDNRGPRVLIPGAVIAPFSTLLEGSFTLFPVWWLLLAAEIAGCYLYHSQSTRSIYLMRRLPDRWELHRRCWGKPMILFVRSLLLIAVLTALFFAIYLLFTPKGCLPY